MDPMLALIRRVSQDQPEVKRIRFGWYIEDGERVFNIFVLTPIVPSDDVQATIRARFPETYDGNPVKVHFMNTFES
jgi:hypothetical protein